jgi:histidinol-phosphatase (PHP family)
MILLYDFHLHSIFSADCKTPAPLMAERACALGLRGLCFTEHFDLDAPDPEGLDFTFDTSAYLREMERLKETYRGRLEIFAGVEIGMQSHVLADVRQYAAAWPFDFIIASQHYINGGDPYYPSYFEGRKERRCYEEFFEVQLANLQQFSSFQTLGHMDYVVRYGPTRNTQYSYASYADYIDPILRHLIDHGKCLEVNTGGFKYGLGQPNPDTTVLQRYRELGGELITIGSDAHSPEHLAYDFARVSELLTGLGFRYYAIFEKQQAKMLRL